jgi:hypothetical protein
MICRAAGGRVPPMRTRIIHTTVVRPSERAISARCSACQGRHRRSNRSAVNMSVAFPVLGRRGVASPALYSGIATPSMTRQK